MKRVKGYKGFIIKETTQKEREEGHSYKFYGFKDNVEIWETDSLQEMEMWIDCY